MSHPDAIADISQQLSNLDNPKLSHFADHLCQQYGFIDPQGNYQQTGLSRVNYLVLSDDN